MDITITGYQRLTLGNQLATASAKNVDGRLQIQPLDAPDYIACGSTKKLDLDSGHVFTAQTCSIRPGTWTTSMPLRDAAMASNAVRSDKLAQIGGRQS